MLLSIENLKIRTVLGLYFWIIGFQRFERFVTKQVPNKQPNEIGNLYKLINWPIRLFLILSYESVVTRVGKKIVEKKTKARCSLYLFVYLYEVLKKFRLPKTGSGSVLGIWQFLLERRSPISCSRTGFYKGNLAKYCHLGPSQHSESCK